MMLVQAVPSFIGGVIVSSAIRLSNNRISKSEAEPGRKSLFNMFNMDPSSKWTGSFMAGMLFFAILATHIFGFGGRNLVELSPFERNSTYFSDTSLLQCILAAFLMGLGARLAKDNLSKWALYQVPAFNRRSIYCAMFSFFVAMVTATFRSSIPLLQGLNLSKFFNQIFDFRLPYLIPLALLVGAILRNLTVSGGLKGVLSSFISGGLLASGLMMAGLTKRHLVLDFLSWNKHWDASLLFFFIGAGLTQMLMAKNMPDSTQAASRDLPELWSPKTLLGCALFEIGQRIGNHW